jgi:Putative transposase
VTFRYKDYRRNGQARYRTMTLAADEFIRRFLLHVLPKGFHRIRHYGLLASAGCKANIARARELMAAPNADGRSATSERHSRSRRHDQSAPAVPLLRRPYDHCRGLCARLLPARPALRRRDQDLMR